MLRIFIMKFKYCFFLTIRCFGAINWSETKTAKFVYTNVVGTYGASLQISQSSHTCVLANDGHKYMVIVTKYLTHEKLFIEMNVYEF